MPLAAVGPADADVTPAAVELRVGEVDAVVAHALRELQQLVLRARGPSSRLGSPHAAHRAAGRRQASSAACELLAVEAGARLGRARAARGGHVVDLHVDLAAAVRSAVRRGERDLDVDAVLAHAVLEGQHRLLGIDAAAGLADGSGEADGSVRLTTPWPAAVPLHAATRAASASHSAAAGRTRDARRGSAGGSA